MKIGQVAAQLYTVRDFIKTPPDIAAAMTRVRKIGYRAVQVSGMGPIAEEELSRILDGEGLVCCATHESSEQVLREPQHVVDRLRKLNCRHTATGPGGIKLDSLANVKAFAARLNASGEALHKAGLVLSYHNHAMEFRRVEGRTILEMIYAETDARYLKAEIDTYWVQYGGGSPLEWCRKMKNRLPLLHMKDFAVNADNQPTYGEVGRGNLNWKEIVPAAEKNGCEWFIVEQDTCAGDPFDSLKISYDYIQRELVQSEDLAKGLMRMQDKAILRDLARKYVEVCGEPVQRVRRDLWKKQNSLKATRPLIYVRAFAWNEMPQARCSCEDPFYRPFEDFFRHQLFWHSLNDDSIFEPWVTVRAAYQCTGWGVNIETTAPDEPGGSFKVDYPIKQLADIEKLRAPWHGIDEATTAANVRRLGDAIGDIITVNVDRGPAYRMWQGDLSTDLGFLRGIEHFMVDMADNPEWLHRLVKFLSDGVLKVHDEAEAAGDWGLCAHQNQAMPYAEELPEPAANVNGVKRSQLWGYMAAQEFVGVSPAMHEEFLLQYQLPILRKFGLAAYGCCEDLTQKIGMLRQIPNLRRIAVSPFADAAKCAQQIGRDYVVSYRPSPSDMVSYDVNPTRIRAILQRDLQACRECHVDVTLKDVQTVQGDPDRVRNWVNITREVIGEVFG